MSRDNVDDKGTKHRGCEIDKKKCPNCPSNRMWVSRGDNPAYQWKCTKCGYRI